MATPAEVDCAVLFEAILEYLMDLFTATPKEQFTRDQVLVILNLVRDDPQVLVLLRGRLTKL